VTDKEHVTLSLDQVDDPDAPTRQGVDFDYIEVLKHSMREHGQLQPIGVVPNGDRYTVIYGHMRTLARRSMREATINAYVYQSTSEAMLGAQLDENDVRKEVNPVEEAMWFAQLWDALQCSTDELALKVHKERDYVEGRLNLLTGDADVRDALHAGKIGLGVAQVLQRYDDDNDRRVLLDAAVAGGASKRLVMDWVAERKRMAAARGGAPAIDPTVQPAPAPETPSPNPLTCVYCEGTEDVYLMVSLWIHKPCWKMLRALLARHFGGVHVEVREASKARV
jgi:ParB/RepB/Spo0J family partition protein